MNETRYIGATNLALSRRFDVPEPGPIGTAGSDIFPTFPISFDQLDADCYHLAGYRLASMTAVVTPTVGQTAAILLANPLDSGVLITCDRIGVCQSVAGDPLVSVLALAPAAPVTTVPGVFRDTRRINQGSTGRLLTYSNPASTGSTLLRRRVIAAEEEQIEGPWVLTEGTCLMVRADAVTLTLVGNFSWRERAANESELSA